MNYILALDQSTQGTKAMLLDEKGERCERVALPHEQIVLANGYVEHNPEEIYHNVVEVVRRLLQKSGVAPSQIMGVGIKERPPLPGIRKPAAALATPWSGNAAAEKRFAAESKRRDMRRRYSKSPA